ncbi:MAG: hypothetical protein GX804_11575 [Lentisphaerae bacterium]|nr:hypothetical protein [Lentisphaerota bacterium]
MNVNENDYANTCTKSEQALRVPRQPRRFTEKPALPLPKDRTRSQRSGTRFTYTRMRVKLEHKKPDVYSGEIVYVYGHVNDYTPSKETAHCPLPTDHCARLAGHWLRQL